MGTSMGLELATVLSCAALICISRTCCRAQFILLSPRKTQPTWVRDVADVIHIMLKQPETAGKTYYLGGPEQLR